MKRIVHAFFIAALLGIFITCLLRVDPVEHHFDGDAMEEDLASRGAWFQKMLADPTTGKVPASIREKEVAFSQSLPAELALGKTYGNWIQRGPWNVGGRTRAIAIDKENENVLIAGGATGGIWRSTDGGVSWRECPLDAPTSNITCIVQDTRKDHTNIWYAGTGELYGGSLPGAFFSGSGFYKSTDGGKTWAKAGNIVVDPGGISSNWSAVFSTAVNTHIDSLNVVFAATFDGIWRSLDSGATWSKRRGGGGSGSSYFTDVAVTPSGIVYATLSGGGSYAGIWRSADNGTTWASITPTGFSASSAGRIVIGISPSDETQVYFAAHTPGSGSKSLNFDKEEEWNSLWKYKYVSGNGTGTGGQWDDRSAFLPKYGGPFGDFISQQGYCLLIRVKPDNPNIVFLGGMNLYRSTDGFTSTANTTWIGGYGVNSPFPDYTVYGNHHPDQHNVIFYPSNPKRMISTHDGGISRTEDNTAPTITWNYLNKGYLTTQFYTVAIDHTTTNNIIIGGLQDNGTLFSNNETYNSDWTSSFGGDGSFCFMSPGATEYYMSKQQGKVYRLILDANGNAQQYARIDPQGIYKNVYQFINPFTPDANLWKRVYIPAGYRMWRNDDVTAIPLKNKLDSTATLLNWNELANTKLADTTEAITAVLSSKTQPDVLYYATERGKLFRLRNASSNASVPENITGNKFPTGYINCIAQDPTDTSKLFVVFTNYNILSVFCSVDGGTSWQPVSGNLEQNSNGSGYGPSCRWLTMLKVQDSLVYFLGTSTGLYATKVLDTMQTVWTRQAPAQIANNIVMMMDARPQDGTLAVATYGAGVFTTKVQSMYEHLSNAPVVQPSFTLFPSPASDHIRVNWNSAPVTASPFEIYHIGGKLVKHGTLNTDGTVGVGDLPPGIYFITLDTGSTHISRKFVRVD